MRGGFGLLDKLVASLADGLPLDLRRRQEHPEGRARGDGDHAGTERVLVDEPSDLRATLLDVVPSLLRNLARRLAHGVGQLADTAACLVGDAADGLARRARCPGHRLTGPVKR